MASAVGVVSTRQSHRSEAVLVLVVAFVMAMFGQASAQVEQEWAARYNGPGNSTDVAAAMAVDAAGNVYVTGASLGADTSADFATVKYDAAGNELWAARYNGAGNSTDRAVAIAVDAAGNVYVTGDSDGSDPPVDFLTVKYDADGNELWVARYSSPGENQLGQAGFIAVDMSGNVYVSGLSLGTSVFPEGYAMVKYDGNGNELWVVRLEYFSSGRTAVALDAAGNAYFTGVRYGLGTSGTGYATFKYDGSGNQVWQAHYSCGYHSGGTGLSLDAAGNVYVTGYCRVSDTTPGGYATVKYDGSGNELWAARYESSDQGLAVLALDASGNVYVTGQSQGPDASNDYTTIKYDAGGDELWAARYNGPGDSDESAAAIALDAVGDIYVTGAIDGDYATIKMVQNGGDGGDGSGGDGNGGGGGCYITAARN